MEKFEDYSAPEDYSESEDYSASENYSESEDAEYDSAVNENGEDVSEQQADDQQYYNQQYYNQQYYNQQNYGQQYQGMQGGIYDESGKKVANNSGVKTVLAVFEMISVLFCNILGLIFGIIACVYAGKTNTAYQQGNKKDFEDAKRTTTISLWIGFAGFLLSIACLVGLVTYAVNDYSEMEEFLWESPEPYDVEEGDLESDSSYIDNGAQDHSQLGEWYKITLNGVTLSLPTTVPEFLESGYNIDEEYVDDVVMPGSYNYYMIRDIDGNYIGWVNIANYTDAEIKAPEGTVYEVDIQNTAAYYEGGLTPDAEFYGGITFDSSEKEFIKILGTPESENHINDGDYSMDEYRWYIGDENDYLSGISISLWKEKIQQIRIIREQN